MIKVNLHQRKVAVGVASGSAAGETTGLQGFLKKFGSGGIGDLTSGSALADPTKRATIILGALYLVLLGGGWWYAGQQKESMLAAVDSEIASLDSKIGLLTSELNKTSGYEQMKKNLEADEKTIRTKINTIQELIRDRSTPPKILMTLAETIPKELWLREFTLKDRHFKIMGNSNNMDIVSDFMRGLGETIYFKSVILKSSKQETVKGGRLNATFELEAERR